MKPSNPSLAERAGAALDAVASAISPAWGARRTHARMQARLASERAAKMAYGSSTDDADRLHGSRRWIGSTATEDDILTEDLSTLQEQSRELARDDSIGGMIDIDVEHVVGTGFTIQAKPDPIDPRGVDTESVAAEIERVLKRWSRRADRTGKKSLWKLSRLAWRCLRTDGECLTILSDVGRADKPIPLAVEVVDIWRLETPPEQSSNPRIRMGVEYASDEGGEILAYWIRKSHPYATKSFSMKYDRVPADRVIHLFDPWFAEQSRGRPWFSRVMNRIKDAKDLDEAGIVAAQVQACFAAFVKGGKGSALRNAEGTATGSTGDGRRIQDIYPGSVNYLDSDQDVSFSAPAAQNGVGPLQELNHRRIAAGMNAPYEFLMRDWRGLSFAGGRLVLNSAKLTVRASQRMLADEWFAAIYRRVVTEAVIVGAISLSARDFNSDPEGWCEHKCTPPKWSYSVNPQQEVDADLAEVAGNLCTLEEKVAERQGDLEEVVAQRGKEIKMIEDAGAGPKPTSGGEQPPAKPASKPAAKPKAKVTT